jgi:YD repeat-containing protein
LEKLAQPGILAEEAAVTDLIRLKTGNFQFDFQNKIFSFDVTLTNVSQTIVFTPIQTVIANLRPGPPTITVVNADGGGSGNGAFFDYTELVGADKLLTGNESSAARNWKFFNPQIKQFSFTVNVEGQLQRLGPPPAAVVTTPASPTKQLNIQVAGNTDPNAQIEIAGGAALATTTANSGGAFTANVALQSDRVNRLFVTAINAAGRSAPAPVSVIHDTQPPELLIDLPPDSTFVVESVISVLGRVSDVLTGFMGLKVTVNGLPANVAVGSGTNGTFERVGIALQFGVNTITATATDTLGNSTTRQIMIERVDPAGQPYIIVFSGNNQKTRANNVLPQPLVVKVFKGDGSPFVGKIVTFDVIRSDGGLADSRNKLGSMTFQDRTDEQGLARAFWRLGSDAGCGNNRVVASSASVLGTALFCASSDPNPAARITVGTGNQQRVEVGSPAPEPLRVFVSDGGNGIANVPVTFTVKSGGGKVGNGADQLTVRTDLTGHTEANYTLGPAPGSQVIEASFAANTGLPATFAIVALERAQQPTSFAGIVLDNSNQPLEGATCILQYGANTLPPVRSNATGHYAFTNIPAGPAKFHVIGSTVTVVNGVPVPQGSFPALMFEPIIVPGVENHLSMPVLLPPLNPNNAVLYDGTKDVELTTEGIAGLRILVKRNSVTLPGNIKPTPANPVLLSFNQVPFGNISMPLPDGLSSPFAWTVQPGGTRFDPPAKMILPNMSGLAPGAITYFYGFNHDTNRFEVIASGSVTADGQFMVSDPSTGITTAGWGAYCTPGVTYGLCYPNGKVTANGNKQKPGNKEPPHTCTQTACIPCGADPMDPVYLFSGEFHETVEDLRIKGRGMDFIWARKYRSQVGPNTAQGNGWDFSYNISIQEEGESVRLGDGNTRSDLYLPETDSTWTRGEEFREFKKGPDSTYALTFADRGQWQFNPLDGRPLQGKISRIVDRNGNRLTFFYDAQGRLSRIRETLDRDILIAYNADGFISTVTDFAGRVVRYTYYGRNETGGNFGDLKSVTTPVVTGTPNGNDFPNGKTTSYTYSTGFANARLNHNLLTITDGRRNTYLNNIYATTTDSNNVNFDRIVRQIWGGDILDVTYVRQQPSPRNGKAVMKVILNDRVGNVKEYFYDVRNRGILMREYTGRANPTLPTTETSNRPTGKLRPTDPNYFETRYEYNYHGMETRIIHPNGNITENVYENELNPSVAARARGNLRVTRRLPGTHPTVGDQAMIEEKFEYDTDLSGCCGFNFVTKHTDGRNNITMHKYDAAGNRIHTQHRIPSIVEDFEYNEFGQMTARVWPDNGSNHRRRDVFTYYGAGPQRGYLRSEIVDSANFALTTINEYDRVGNIIRVIDPRGHDTQYVVNALDQAVREISREITDGSGIRYQRDTFYDANDNVVRRDVQNIDERGRLQANTHFTTLYDYEILNNMTHVREEVAPQDTIVTEYAYDNNRNRTLVRYGEATAGRQPTNIIRTLYDERDLVFREIRAFGDPQQSTTQYDYDRNKNLVVRRQGLENVPRVSTMVYDSYDRLVNSTDPMGNVTANNYDANSNRVRMRLAGERNDVAGSTSNVRLDSTVYVYDAMDRLIRTATAFFDTDTQIPIADGLAVSQIFYSANSQVLRRMDDNNHETLMRYDTANRLSVTTDDNDNTITYAYDANGNAISTTEVEKSDLGNPDETFVTTNVYDNLDRLIKTTDNVGNINEYGYDSRNNRTLHLDALRPTPNTSGNRTKMQYDGLNRLIRTVRYLTSNGAGNGVVVDSIVTRQAWDHTSRLISQTDDNNNATVYSYDPLNRKIATTYADNTVHRTTYDVHDNAITMTDANGSVATCTYDLNDRLIAKSIARGDSVRGTTFESFQYDGRSRLVRARDDDSDVTRSYNSLSMVTAETLNGQTTTSIYDGVGNKLSCTYPGGRRIVTSYDELDRKQLIVDQFGPIAEYKYIGPARVARRDYANQTRCTYEYDRVKRIIGTTHAFVTSLGDTVELDKRSYTWDQMYNKTSRRDLLPNGTAHTYQYDSIYRLARSTKTPATGSPTTIDYGFDGVGNRATVTGGSDAGSYFMNNTQPEPADFQMNQYTTTPFDARLNDRNGNLQRLDNGLPSQRDFVYDYRNQMIEHRDNTSGAVARYSYDALGRRIAKVVTTGATSVTTRFFYDDWQEIEEQNENGVTQASYVYGLYIDEALNMQRDVDGNGDAEDYYYHTDDLYNVMVTTDTTGVVERYEYGDYGQPQILDANGNPINATRSLIDNSYLFTGRRHDPELAFYYYRTRYLDARAGRFINRDQYYSPSIKNFSSPDTIHRGTEENLYAYVTNNPLKWIDPLGLYRCFYFIREHRLVCLPNDPTFPCFDSDRFTSGNDQSQSYRARCTNCQNNPDRTDVQSQGPIPPGLYNIEAKNNPRRNHQTWRYLEPVEPIKRGPFAIHGCGNPNTCSEGCLAATDNNTRDDLDFFLRFEEGKNRLTVMSITPPISPRCR